MTDDTIDAPAVEDVPADDRKFVVVYLASVTFDLPAPSPMLRFVEESVPYRQLTFPIGLPEAQSLAAALEQSVGARPTTHELMITMLRNAKTDIAAVRIVDCRNGIYYAELDLVSPSGRTVLDCRPTDAAILAMRQAVKAPILCLESLLV